MRLRSGSLFLHRRTISFAHSLACFLPLLSELWYLRGGGYRSFLVAYIKRPLKNRLYGRGITRISVTPATITGFLRLCGVFSRFKVSSISEALTTTMVQGLRGTKAAASPCIFMKTGLQSNLFNFSVIALSLAEPLLLLNGYSTCLRGLKKIDFCFSVGLLFNPFTCDSI